MYLPKQLKEIAIKEENVKRLLGIIYKYFTVSKLPLEPIIDYILKRNDYYILASSDLDNGYVFLYENRLNNIVKISLDDSKYSDLLFLNLENDSNIIYMNNDFHNQMLLEISNNLDDYKYIKGIKIYIDYIKNNELIDLTNESILRRINEVYNELEKKFKYKRVDEL